MTTPATPPNVAERAALDALTDELFAREPAVVGVRLGADRASYVVIVDGRCDPGSVPPSFRGLPVTVRAGRIVLAAGSA